MVSLGIIDIVLIILLLISLYAFTRRRSVGLALVFIVIFIVIMVERLAPGSLAAVGNVIHGIDRVNDSGPHLTINPLFSFK